jgi:hypothetical protein
MFFKIVEKLGLTATLCVMLKYGPCMCVCVLEFGQFDFFFCFGSNYFYSHLFVCVFYPLISCNVWNHYKPAGITVLV